MTSPSAGRARFRGAGARLFERVIAELVRLLSRLLPVVPTDVLFALADGIGTVAWLIDARGRSIGRQNLEVAFGVKKTPRERARILRASYRNAVRNEMLLFHLAALPPQRLQRWVHLAPADHEFLRRQAALGWRGVMASAHLGNWELLLLSRHAYDFAPSFAYLAETTGSRALDVGLERLRDLGRGGWAMRKSGALALRSALAQGKVVSLMMDRNLRGERGGDYVPFLGLPARTTPLAARLAHAYDVPLVTVLMLPAGRRRWRLAFSEPLMPAPSGDTQADVRAGLARANERLGEAILRHPETYLWTLKRWKSRPTPEQGRYPAYSYYDPEERHPAP